MTVAVVTGANSGIGRQVAVDLAGKGWDVYGTMRSLEKGDKLEAMAAAAGVSVTPIICEVTDDDSVTSAMASIIEQAGRIDVLVNNAGVAGNGVLEEVPIDTYKQVMDVNLYGVVRCVQAVLPQMREQGSGVIVNISSIVGRFAALGQSPYVVSKWALEGLSEGLAQEVAPFGIRVVIIEPGIVKTAILAKNTDAPNETGQYDQAYRRLFAFYMKGMADPGHPSEVSEVVYEACTADKPKFRYTCGWGGSELINGRASITDDQWLDLGAIESDTEYAERFGELFGLDIS
jgi:NAD(P)-dependent dehydrogenase (short-subunit alcohol dehydrogenase family)